MITYTCANAYAYDYMYMYYIHTHIYIYVYARKDTLKVWSLEGKSWAVPCTA